MPDVLSRVELLGLVETRLAEFWSVLLDCGHPSHCEIALSIVPQHVAVYHVAVARGQFAVAARRDVGDLELLLQCGVVFPESASLPAAVESTAAGVVVRFHDAVDRHVALFDQHGLRFHGRELDVAALQRSDARVPRNSVNHHSAVLYPDGDHCFDSLTGCQGEARSISAVSCSKPIGLLFAFGRVEVLQFARLFYG